MRWSSDFPMYLRLSSPSDFLALLHFGCLSPWMWHWNFALLKLASPLCCVNHLWSQLRFSLGQRIDKNLLSCFYPLKVPLLVFLVSGIHQYAIMWMSGLFWSFVGQTSCLALHLPSMYFWGYLGRSIQFSFCHWCFEDGRSYFLVHHPPRLWSFNIHLNV